MHALDRFFGCLVLCVTVTMAAAAGSLSYAGGASPAPGSQQWTLLVKVPSNCSIPHSSASAIPAFIACEKPCDVTGSLSYAVRKGDSLTVVFQARPGVVITGASQNLEFMNDPIEDMKVMTAAAPSNPVTPVTYTGFRFAPEQDYYQSFQAGVLANLAVLAFDTSTPSRNKTDGVLGMYKTASCRTSIQLHLLSPPPNVTIGAGQLYSAADTPAMQNSPHMNTTAIVVPCVIGGFILAVGLGCLILGLAKKRAAALPK